MNPKLEDDPIAFAKAAAEQLAPVGVTYFEYGGMKLMLAPVAAPSASAGPSGLTTQEEAELERLMEQDAPADPLDDPTTFPGGRVPSYGAAKRRKRAADDDVE